MVGSQIYWDSLEKMANLFLTFVTIFLLKTTSAVITSEPLHLLMTETELSYFFGAEHRNSLPDYELIYLPVEISAENVENADVEALVDDRFDYGFNAFGRRVDLKLKLNKNLVSPNFQVFVKDSMNNYELESPIRNCHYLHSGSNLVAAISSCNHQINGLVFLQNLTLEIQPLTKRLQSYIKLNEALEEFPSETKKIPHLVKRAPEMTYPVIDSEFSGDQWQDESGGIFDLETLAPRPETKSKRAANGHMTIETALFFDAAAYKLFNPYMKNSDERMRDMLLAYINGVQALYHHPSLGTTLDIVLVRMDLMKTQPSDMPHYDGERSKLLDSFCDYQKKVNPPGDDNPKHWDMALYVSGLDFYAMENGRKSGITMGLATVGGVCLDRYNCVIAELGTTNVFGKPYPSAGFTSVYILAHEIGHNLGMHHDSSGNNCPKDGFIMSPSRGTNGETLWSTCSAEVMRQLSSYAKCLFDSPSKPAKGMDHTRFLNTPGQFYGAKKQCELLLRDRDGTPLPSQELSTICYNLQCKTPHRSGYYFAGPALEGTNCGNGKWCIGGECVKIVKQKPIDQTPGGWSQWKEDTCKSGCIENSMGYQSKHRICDNPPPLNSEDGCKGTSFEVALCKDAKICNKNKRKPVSVYATAKCKQFAKRLPELDPAGSGLQAPHEQGRPWMGCAIFCRRKDSGSYYTPRVELNDLGVSPYFPDGTWCHKDGTGNYYCVQHHCLPENFQFTKMSIWEGIGEDIPISQNAHPRDLPVPPSLLSYLSLGADGKPLQTTIRPGQTKAPKEEDWEIHDYVELPNEFENDIQNIFG